MAEKEGKTEGQALKKCFIIMPISDVDGYPKGHFDRVYEYIIAPACKQAEYEVVRADGTSKANVIIVDILKHVYDCDMAICDLSARNPNVFYELGFRQAFNKKTVLMIDDKTTRPFDISGLRSFPYDSSLRIDLVNKAISDLTKALKETSEMSEQEPNSLLKLLSVENPAKLPDGHKLSDDSSLILQAIRDLSEDVRRNMRGKRKTYAPYGTLINETSLPDGSRVKIGDSLYYLKNGQEMGTVVELTPETIVVKRTDGSCEIVPVESSIIEGVSVTPF